MTAQTTDRELAARLRLSVGRLARLLRQQGPGDLTLSQLSALYVIGGSGGIGLRELAATERVQPPTMSRLVDILEKAGYVTRVPDPSDRRAVRHKLSAAGRRLMNRSQSKKNSFLVDRFARLDAPDRSRLEGAVEVLEALLQGEEVTK